ncbi:MAG: Calx-beta domain-containing protein, partial [Bacteroidota bacterium]
MIKRFTFLIMALFIGYASYGQDLIITGIIDGPLPNGRPKAVELYATDDIADLSLYGIGSATNGNAGNGSDFELSGSATAGDYLYVTANATEFNTFFGITADFTSSAVNVNGDDVIELFFDATGAFSGTETVIDVFGELGVDGSGEVWDYLDGWAYRKDGTTAGGSTFTSGDWIYSGVGALSGESDNATAANPFPIGTYSDVAPTNTIVTFTSETGSAAEGDGTTTISVSIANPSASTATTVDVALTTGTAADLNNYTTQTVNFPANASADQTVTLTITDDALLEGNEI